MSQKVEINQKGKGFFGSPISKIQYITVLAMLVALGIALKTVTVYLSSTAKVSFVFLPEAITAVVLGPAATIIQAGLTDVIGIILFPADGGFMPQFTVSALVAGTITGVTLRKKVTLPRIVLSRVFVNIIVYIILNSIWMEQIYKMPFKVRIFTELLKCPITCAAEIIILTITLPIIARVMKPFGFMVEVSENVNLGNLKTGFKNKIFPFAGTVVAALGLMALGLNCLKLEFDGQRASYSYYGLITDKLFPVTVDGKSVATLEIVPQFKYLMLIPIALAACSAVFSIFSGKAVRAWFGLATAVSVLLICPFMLPSVGEINMFDNSVTAKLSIGIILFVLAFVIYCLLPVIEHLTMKKKEKE